MDDVSFVQFAKGTVVNLCVLLGFVALCALLRGWSVQTRRPISRWAMGLLFGAMAFVTMLTPVASCPGFVFDCRSGVVGSGALLGGPITAILSLPLPVLYRVMLGGSGTVPGVLELILPALLGSLLYHGYHRAGGPLDVRRIGVSSLLVGLGGNIVIVGLLFLFAPEKVHHVGASGNIFLVILSTPVSMFLLTSMIVMERKHGEALDAMADSERRMLHSQKMAAVGQLSRKVSHSFLNALTVVMNNAQLAKMRSTDCAQVERLMDDLAAAAEKASELTADLLAFSSPGTFRFRRMTLGACVSGIERMLRKTIGPEIELVVELDPHVGRVDVDPDRMEQAIVHLAVNASEAMAGHGTLTIQVSNAELSKLESERIQAGFPREERVDAGFALLTITDTGCGMSGETVQRIFEPFFSTKKRGQNAGLGLATVYNIVHQHSGIIDVHSRVGRGTTFLIYIPLVPDG